MRRNAIVMRRGSRRSRLRWVSALSLLAAACRPGPAPVTGAPAPATTAAQRTTSGACQRTVSAHLVALNQAVMLNRLGTVRPGGMIYALAADVMPVDAGAPLGPGNVMLRPDRRPRPVVLRLNVGDCLDLQFDNLLLATAPDPIEPVTSQAGVHVEGLELRDSILDDGTWVGQNPSSLVESGKSATYRLRAPREGTFLLYSKSADFNGFFNQQVAMGLFGAVHVEPAEAEWFRSQVTAADLVVATKGTSGGYPIIDYQAHYPADWDVRHPEAAGRACRPVLQMLDLDRAPVKQGNQWVCRTVGSALSIQHGDLTAIITGPGAGPFRAAAPGGPQDGAQADPQASAVDQDRLRPDRLRPYREITVLYHESLDAIQPFAEFYDDKIDPQSGDNKSFAWAASIDGFAINYGVAGIGPEVVANRLGVGPMWNCPECKFEEFFLNSWAAGDPAMLVDVPANTPMSTRQLEAAAVATLQYKPVPPITGRPTPGPKATKAFYPDDPSNVYHGYQSDPVRFRVLHAGEAVTHVHHLHAHQWLYNSKESGSNYLDSQAIGPGASFTADLVYNGAGNLNRTSGDSIFHCHFYPHFAGGMWALFRVHDVFEAGTQLDGNGRPAAGSRALPDGEIQAGTPIPAVVPIPGVAMAPLPAPVHIERGQAVVPPGNGNPGYPFFVPGLAGHRPPQPPLDFALGDDGKPIDGGLPRHRVKDGTVAFQKQTVWDFSKESATLVAEELDERGTDPERRAMAAHAQRAIPTRRPDGTPADFPMTGVPPAPGAPFANPAPETAKLRRYKGADIQLDVVLNRKGWHFPQQRMMSLWEDVKPTLAGQLAPTPLFFRANSGEAVEYWHTNLVPSYYELDDFQVRTPTDVLGQHIHLVKFDVTSSDGGSNGFNYEDGTFSPDEVRERISAINKAGGIRGVDGKPRALAPRPHPYFGAGEGGKWVGAQTTIQRWYAEPILDAQGNDRTITTVFTHDHLGPSTHQQAGLYGALVIEPPGSVWTSLDGKVTYGSRALDGGPTSPMANIVPPTAADSYREFLMEWQDLQLAYDGQSRSRPDCYKVGCDRDPAPADCPLHCLPVRRASDYRGWADPRHAINAPPFPPDGTQQSPQPQAIAIFGAGTFSMNYRSEPVPLRVTPPAAGAAPLAPASAAEATDLAHAFRSIPRLDPAFNAQPVGGSPIDPACDPRKTVCLRYPKQPISAGMGPTDPFTPLLRAYAGDKVQVRAIAGAHTSMHDVVVHGMKWLFEPHVANSGWRASQFDSLSEHFELHFTMPPAALPAGRDHADYLYSPSTSYEGLVNGTWGLLRAFDGGGGKTLRPDLQPLPNNPGGSVAGGAVVRIPDGLGTDCRSGKPCLRTFQVSAVTAGQALGHPLYYNARGTVVRRDDRGRTAYALDPALPLEDPDALLYVRDEDLDDAGALRPGVPVEPLVLRASAGDWIRVTLRNCLTGREPPFQPDHATDAAKPSVPYSFAFAGIKLATSPSVGLHPQLVAYDITRGDGFNAGDNPVQTVPPDAARAPGDRSCKSAPRRDYVWYAGSLTPRADGTLQATPVEFGSVNLMPADPLVHHHHGLVGALVVEPAGASWIRGHRRAHVGHGVEAGR